MRKKQLETNLSAKVADIKSRATRLHERYYRNGTFSGPSLHFHRRALGLEGEVTPTEQIELIYAALVSWGMHRMGRGGSKMLPFAEFRASAASLQAALTQARKFSPATMTSSEWLTVESIFKGLRVMDSGTTIVGNSKVLAHLLPRIVPPIDRRYSLNYLLGRDRVRNDLDEEWRIMRRVLEEFFYPLATDPEFGRQTQAWLGEPLMYPWDTGILKIIDNLVIAAMKS